MTKYTFEPQIGFGPLQFGLSPEEASAILGDPTEVTILEDVTVWPDDLLEFVQDRVIHKFDFDQGAHIYLVFYRDALVSIEIHDLKTELTFESINLFSDDRSALTTALEVREDVSYINDDYLFFPEAGILIPNSERWKKRIERCAIFRLTSYEMKQFSFSDWEKLED